MLHDNVEAHTSLCKFNFNLTGKREKRPEEDKTNIN